MKSLIQDVSPYHPTDEQKDAIYKVYSDYEYARSLRDQTYSEFDDLTPDQYWEESRKRVKNYLPPLPFETELSNMFIGMTRNKRNVIAGFVAAQRPRVELDVRGGMHTKKTDKRLATMLRTTYDFFMDKESADEKYLDWAIEALDVGTGHMQETYDFLVRDVKIAVDEDFGTGETTYETQERIDKDQCSGRTLPIEDVFIGDFYQPDIQEQPFVIIRELVHRRIATERYGDYPEWSYVPYGRNNEDKEDDTFFFDLLENRIEHSFVEVLHYYNKQEDLYLICANGVLLNAHDNAIPYDHKRIPVAKNVYEKMGSTFYYGMSMAMKVVTEQDALNESVNNNMDRSRISSIPTAIASYESEIEQDYIGSYNILKVDNDSNLRELGFQSVKSGDMAFIEFLRNMISEATVSDSFSGAVQGATATEIMYARAQNQQNLGPFLTYVYAAAKAHAELRLANILQYFFMTSKKYNGKEFDTREISVRTQLQDGKDGVRIIRVMSSKDKIPPKSKRQEELQKGIIPIKDEFGNTVDEKVDVNYDYIYVTPQEIADIQYTMTIVPGSSLPELQSLKVAKANELAVSMASPMFAPITDPMKMQQIVVEANGYTVDDVRPDDNMLGQQAAQDTAMMGGGQPQETGQNPTLNQNIDQLTQVQDNLNQLA